MNVIFTDVAVLLLILLSSIHISSYVFSLLFFIRYTFFFFSLVSLYVTRTLMNCFRVYQYVFFFMEGRKEGHSYHSVFPALGCRLSQ